MTNEHHYKQEPSSIVKWLFLLYLLFAVYGSLVPFQYVYRPLNDAIQTFKTILFAEPGIDSWSDGAANLLLFIPLTLLASLLINTGGNIGRRVLVAFLIASAAIMLSVGIEFTQLFFPQRTVSQTDIFAESVGGLIGVGCHWLLGTGIQNWLHDFWRGEQQQDRPAKILHAYLILLFVLNVLPLDLTLSPGEVYLKFKESLIPFSSWNGALSTAVYKIAAYILIWIPAGLLWALQAGSTFQRVVLRGIIAATVFEILKLFVHSRGTDITQAFLAGMGVSIGWALVQGKGNALPGKLAGLADGLQNYLGGSSLSQPIEVAATHASRINFQTTSPHPSMPWLADFKTHLACVAGFSTVLCILFRMPGLPYNFYKLVGPGPSGVVSAVGLSLTVYAIGNGAFLLFPPQRRRWFLAFPACLVIQGLVTWCLLRLCVPLEMLEKVLGSVVLDWSWEGEMLYHYLALHMILAMQVLGAVLFVRVILKPATLTDFLYWAMISVAMAWPLHLVVVKWATTDNLTELMADDASFLASSALASALFLTCLAASALSAALNASKHTWTLAGLALTAAMGATAFYWLGTEHNIVKYDQVFSTFQFLLSTDRKHYAQGASLMFRYVLAFATICGGLAAIQWSSWRWFCRTDSTTHSFAGIIKVERRFK